MVKEGSKDLYAIGRRKSAVARVKVISDSKDKTVNDKPIDEYFETVGMLQSALSPLELTSSGEQFGLVVKVKGGGKQAQADAIKHGVAKALLQANPDWRSQLKAAGMLTRDARVKERKKYGLKRARRAPQFSKR